MKKYMSILLLMVASASTGYAQDCRPPQFCCPQPVQCAPVPCAPPACVAPCAPCVPFFTTTQIGIAVEENLSRGDVYGYISGTLKGSWYYELRGYGIWNFITQTPPATIGSSVVTPAINNREQKTVYGTGFVGIFGYVIKLPCTKATLTPYFRYDLRSNNAGPVYRDERGNSIKTWGQGYLGGARINMPVNDQLSVGFNYWGGYIKVKLHGRGFFGHTTDVLQTPRSRSHYPTLQGNFQHSFSYAFNKCWSFGAWWQITLTASNAQARVTDAPSQYVGKVTRLTAASYLWGARIGYNF